jgi:L-aspartate oxidase
LFATSTNPAVATGDGLAMALRAGAAVADLEFIQFHPTALFAGAGAAAGGQLPLISEAVRGAGALLIDGAGHRVMTGVHPLEDLAPRDVVALAINRRLAENPGGIGDHVFLDARMIDGFARRFPTITASCAEAGIDPASEPIPVAPAAHYQCGGVDTDLRGRTTVAGLYAVGEVSRTGLHGANRLASNSLLEALVMGGRTAEDLAATIAGRRIRGAVDVVAPTVTIADPGDRSILQAAMSRSAGIVRDAAGLATIEPPSTRSQGVNGRQAPAGVSTDPAPAGSPAGSMESIEPMGSELSDGVETANLALAARAVVRAATLRTESRGCHFRSDHPGRILGWAQPISLTLADGDLVVAELREAVAS